VARPYQFCCGLTRESQLLVADQSRSLALSDSFDKARASNSGKTCKASVTRSGWVYKLVAGSEKPSLETIRDIWPWIGVEKLELRGCEGMEVSYSES